MVQIKTLDEKWSGRTNFGYLMWSDLTKTGPVSWRRLKVTICVFILTNEVFLVHLHADMSWHAVGYKTQQVSGYLRSSDYMHACMHVRLYISMAA